MLDAPFAQFGLAIFRSVRPPLHGNRERSQVLPGVVRSKDGGIRQTRSPGCGVGILSLGSWISPAKSRYGKPAADVRGHPVNFRERRFWTLTG